MSAIETMPDVVIGKKETYFTVAGDQVDSYAVLIGGEKIGTLYQYQNYHTYSLGWQLSLFGCMLHGHGENPAATLRDAFGDALSEMQSAIDRARAVSVEHGDKLMAAVEGLK